MKSFDGLNIGDSIRFLSSGYIPSGYDDSFPEVLYGSTQFKENKGKVIGFYEGYGSTWAKIEYMDACGDMACLGFAPDHVEKLESVIVNTYEIY